ncbi:MAG: polysaccharide deacetylase [Caulobacteraceae bacterium]
MAGHWTSSNWRFDLSDHSPFGALAVSTAWAMIDAERAVWRQAGRTPRLWWRDDDARRPSPALTRLLGLADAHRTPLALAVIPDGDLTDLADAIGGRGWVRAIQHGCDHIDRNLGGGFSAEFAPSAPPAEVAEAINAGWWRLTASCEAIPIYAPPWNRLTPNARCALADTPLKAVSLYGAPSGDPDGPIEINTHIDIMNWRPARFRGAWTILQRLWRQLRARRKAARWNEPIGLLTHHKNLDAEAWSFLEAFLERATGPGAGFAWRSAAEILEGDR